MRSMTWEKPTRFLRLNRPHRLQRIFSNGVGLFCFYQWSDTLKPHTQGDIIKHRKGVADGTEIRRGI